MGRQRGKKALYEVIGKSRIKPASAVEKLRDDKAPEQKAEKPPEKAENKVEPAEIEQPQPEPQAPEPEIEEPVDEELDEPVPDPGVEWKKKPDLVQVNDGRVEFSLPYQLCIVACLGVIVLVLGAYRLGQMSMAGEKQPVSDGSIENSASQNADLGNPEPGIAQRQNTPEPRVESPRIEQPRLEPQPATTPPSTGSNRIVIQSFSEREDLVPVQKYFEQCGVATEIRQIGGSYLLVTSRKFENPNKVGTDGYRMKQKIVELGAGYEAPQGYESFAPKLFSDAYGMKFDD